MNTAAPPAQVLGKLRELWQEHGNIGALRDAFWLCGRHTEPPLPMPEWLVDAIDVQLLNPDTTVRWRRYCRDMLALHRLDLFRIAHAHGISREEAAQFVVDCEKQARRDARELILNAMHPFACRLQARRSPAAAAHGRLAPLPC